MSKEKLLEIFNEANKFFYSNQSNKNQKSLHWNRFDKKKFTLDNLINFRGNGNLSEGLDDQNNNFIFKTYFEIANKISESYLLNNLPKKNIGNSNFLKQYKDVFVDYNKLIHIYWFWIIENKILKNTKVNNICEIGGGFGSFSELFLKNYNIKVLLIDLPEANLISTYYLKELFPDKKFYLFNDYKKNNYYLSSLDFEKNDIIILPPNCNIDKKIKIDFFINARSMMEMNFDVIKSYFNFIHEYLIEGGYFLNVNRYEKKSTGYPIRISDYPYDTNWKVIISEPSFKQNWIHFLLTQRSFVKVENNITKELKDIEMIGRKFYGLHDEDDPRFATLKKILIIIFGEKLTDNLKNFVKNIINKF